MADPEGDQSPTNLRCLHQSKEEWHHHQIQQIVAVTSEEVIERGDDASGMMYM